MLANRFNLLLALSILTPQVITQFAGTIHNGVAIGGWLLAESWMYPNRWQRMGGERCDQDASKCAATEWSLVKKLGQTQANKAFLNHWKTWFTQEHVNRIKALNLDHVNIPLGFWIIEELVQQPAERYPQGGWMELKRGLRQLKEAGINALISMHALPGVSTANQDFAGNNTDQLHFYEEGNYRRALTWASILTAMSHLNPDFQGVLGILCINEPERDTAKTPGLEQYYADFVTIVRVMEFSLGIPCDVNLQPAIEQMATSHNAKPALLAAIPLLPVYAAKANPPIDVTPLTSFLTKHCHDSIDSPSGSDQPLDSTQSSTHDSASAPITPGNNTSETPTALLHIGLNLAPETTPDTATSPESFLPPVVSNASDIGSSQYVNHMRRFMRRSPSRSSRHRARRYKNNSSSRRSQQTSDRFCITTMAMPKTWQWQNDSASMAPHVLGPRAFDDHLYFAYGGVAKNATYESYLDTICPFDRQETAKANGEVPYGMGEYSIATNFNSTYSELRGWGDAQKIFYGKTTFSTFWNFRIEDPTEPDRVNLANQWSYLRAYDLGLLPDHPSRMFNTSVCKGRERKPNPV